MLAISRQPIDAATDTRQKAGAFHVDHGPVHAVPESRLPAAREQLANLLRRQPLGRGDPLADRRERRLHPGRKRSKGREHQRLEVRNGHRPPRLRPLTAAESRAQRSRDPP